MQLEQLITDLLREHNCVIVPDFGGFIGNYESAWINPSRRIIYPPFKQILFNTRLTQNDGLLTHALVQQENTDFASASAQIAERVKFWKKQLESDGRIEFGEVGFLFRENGQIHFEQNRETNLLLQAFGLHQLSFVSFEKAQTESVTVSKTPEKIIPAVTLRDKVKPVSKPKLETPVISLNTEESIEEIREERAESRTQDNASKATKPKRKNYRYALAAAAIIPVMFYAYWIPAKTDFLSSGKLHLSDFNPMSDPARPVYEKRTDLPTFQTESAEWKSWEELTGSLPQDLAIYNFEFSEDLYIPVKLHDGEVNTGSPNAPFQVITGCFSVKSNAENHVQSLSNQGFQAFILDKNKGLWRVSAGGFGSQESAESLSDQLESKGNSAWVLKK